MKKTMKTKLLITGLMAQVIASFPGVSTGLTIDEAVTLALQNNPDLQKEQMNLALSEEELSGKSAQKFGKIDLVTSYGHECNPSPAL